MKCVVLKAKSVIRYFNYKNLIVADRECPEVAKLVRFLNNSCFVFTTKKFKVLDIVMGDNSAGHYTVTAFCKVFGLKQAKVLYLGDYNFDAVRQFDGKKVVVIPLSSEVN